ncbi:PIN domain-containing protein [Eggerthella sp. YY7918]|uniref:type II toxin-antitoxin system VapC family toxin n=1 Tax=Eggerthella sp. (strain YY7918) TaxID=502558 RepID=UPI0002171031|nr:PIN domain-containing protein [Eggerthella sp. YY7918]BAK43390.1 ABC-type dipeptide/oligopeptide/nickel transport system, periplasmic component [Eggerthella sp. YY7918]
MKHVYWDACCFIDYLEGNERGRQVRGVLEKAQNGELVIVTSVLSLIEVLGDKDASEKERQKIKEAMRPQCGIQLVDLTRHLAESAREFVWQYSYHKHSKDAVHLATALYVTKYQTIDEIHSFDNDLLKLDGRVGIRIVQPSLENYPESPKPLFDENGYPTNEQ